jgi:hypothetical protein
MFIGHLGLALAAKQWLPATSLGLLVLATLWVDTVWPLFLILGIEHVRIVPGITAVTPLDFYDYPWTHSLLAGVLWGAGFAATLRWRRRRTAVALVCAGLVVSHWFLDVLVHRPDLPIVPGGRVYGLGLWHSREATAAAEVPLFCLGLLLYLNATTARDPRGRWGVAALVLVVLAAYVANLQGQPPPSVPVMQWTALLLSVLLVVWAWWADRHRTPHTTRGGSP